MNNYSIYLPSYSIGDGIYHQISSICSPYGKKAIAIGGSHAIEATKEAILLATEGTALSILDFLQYGNEASYENVERLMKHPLVKGADMIFAIGGGKALDTCKCLSVKLNKPLFTFPTVASGCAAMTTYSIMYYPDGRIREPFFFAHPPIHTFINTAIIAKAPKDYLRAAMADTYSLYYETSISTRNETLEHFYGVGVSMSKMCLDPIIKCGEQALSDNEKGSNTYEFEQVVLAVFVTSSVVCNLLTTKHSMDYRWGLAHAVYSSLPEEIQKKYLHGDLIGLATLIQLLADDQMWEHKLLYDFNKSIGLPTSFTQIGVSEEMFIALIPEILAKPDLHLYAYKVTQEMILKAYYELKDREDN